MPPKPNLARVDKALLLAAGLAAKSGKLSAREKAELRALVVKGAKRGAQGWNTADRLRCMWLIKKAGPEALPKGEVPDWLRKLLRRSSAAGEDPVRERAGVDPLTRLVKLGELRGAVLSEEQFASQVTKVMSDPFMPTYGAADGVDPLDRLSKVGELQSLGVLTEAQASALTSQILDASV